MSSLAGRKALNCQRDDDDVDGDGDPMLSR